MTWWALQPSRALSEKMGLAELAEEHAWLQDLTWRFGANLELTVDFKIVHAGETFPLSLSFPAYFPDVPPLVTPMDGKRISGHQYGAGGELCLEYRADNWDISFTSRMMVESAHRLISGERDPTTSEPVPSAHAFDLGRDLRGNVLRFLLTDNLWARLNALPVGQPTSISIALRSIAGNFTSTVKSLGSGDDAIQFDELHMPGARDESATAIHAGDEKLPATAQLPDLIRLLKSFDAADTMAEIEGKAFVRLLIVEGRFPRLFSIFGDDGERSVLEYDWLPVLAEHGVRDHSEQAALSDKRVGIIGCGSIGSKIATSLARCGVGNFVLVDNDVFLPGNIVRNDLDWSSVGLHKATALRHRLRLIAKDCQVKTRNVQLGGQESAATTASVMKDLAGCHLIVDATAEAKVFNLVGAIARRERVPVVWAEVFGGGGGGLVARSRPGIDPPPQIARRQLNAWCERHGIVVPTATTGSYASTDDAPMVADDGDVSVIAAHATRLAADTLCRPGASVFPSPAYVVGLGQSWIFSAPFETYPVDYVAEGEWGVVVEEAAAEKIEMLLSHIMPESSDDQASPSA